MLQIFGVYVNILPSFYFSPTQMKMLQIFGVYASILLSVDFLSLVTNYFPCKSLLRERMACLSYSNDKWWVDQACAWWNL